MTDRKAYQSAFWPRAGTDLRSLVLIVAMAAIMMVSAAVILGTDGSDADGTNVTVTNWDELQDALGSAASGTTIVLANDIFDSSDRDPEEFGEGRDLTIDLAGFTLGRGRGGMGYDSGRLFVIEGATVTIKNGEMGGGNEDKGGVIYMSYGKLTLDSVNSGTDR
jgi:hypothetical protein